MTPLQQAVADFVTFAKGQELHFPGCPGTQCMCIPHWFLLYAFGLKDKTLLAQPYAREVYENFATVNGHQYFDQIANTPDNFPLIGDIVIGGAPLGSYKDATGQVAYAGHIMLAIADGNTNTFTSLDENWGATPTVATVVTHDYVGIEKYGWLRPNASLLSLLTTNASQVQQQLKTELDAVDACQAQLKEKDKQLTIANATITTQQNRIDELANQVVDLQKDKESLQLQCNAVKSENDKLIQENDLFTTDRKNYNDEANTAKSQAAKLTEYLDTIAAHAGVEFRGQTDDKITSSVMLVLSQQAQKISDLTNQLKRYIDVKNAISQTTVPLTPYFKFATKQNIFRSLLSIFWTQQ